jgi:hypothetical protein
MSVAQKNFMKAFVELKRSQGHNLVTRKSVAEAWLREDEQPTYGTQTPFGRAASVYLKEIATELGGKYLKDTNGKNARIEF